MLLRERSAALEQPAGRHDGRPSTHISPTARGQRTTDDIGGRLVTEGSSAGQIEWLN
jgi:hypothetical protein